MVRIKGNIQMPENMLQIVNTVSEGQKNKNGYLSAFEHLIDPVILGIFYGLYKSQELPPIDVEEKKLKVSHEFNVDLDPYDSLLNHYLFCLWIYKNGSPDKSSDIIKYREALYNFVSKILDTEYYKNVVIPFYLEKADESEGASTSFLYRIWNSNNVGIELQRYSPEYLSLEFSTLQDDFMKKIVKPLGPKREELEKT
jgi:hypothetical protein